MRFCHWHCFFLLILVYMTKAGSTADTTEHYLQTRFDYAYTMMLGYGLVFLLPCLIGIIAAVLFFMERDCDTFKNLYERSPLRIRNSFWLRFLLLFIFGISFCIISTLVSCVCFAKVFQMGMVYGMGYKLIYEYCIW